MTNKEVCKLISKMSSWELLEWVISSPTDLTDSYYSEFRDAILKRYDELRKIKQHE